MKKTFLFGLFVILMITTGHKILGNDLNINSISSVERSFKIDYLNNTFTMNGQPFRYVSGSFHYFRALPETWQSKLRTMRAAGLNAVSTYVEWSLHNPKDGTYNWEGIANLERFIQLAQHEDLYVLLRPGPYICGERDMGGLPFWLLNKYPFVQLRTHDPDYLYEVGKWYAELMPRMQRFLYGNGGPIIMVQVENEYGSFSACDKKYGEWLRDETLKYVGTNAVLYTTDGPSLLNCGHIENVYATIDFGATKNVAPLWAQMRKTEPQGPLVNSEFYPGWLTHWQENAVAGADTLSVTSTLRQMLNDGANVNFYMFFGGTNFGFTAGANDQGLGRYQADLTSYDYDAPMTEAGDPTPKYMAIRDVISQYFALPNITVPPPSPKSKWGKIMLRPISVILSQTAKQLLGTPPVTSIHPMSFEALGQFSGLVLYETVLPKLRWDPSPLIVNKLHDRAQVYIDRNFIGTLSRENQINMLPINANSGVKLQILVENQGRINYNIANDFKGILGDVRLKGQELTNWVHTGFPLENYTAIEGFIERFLRSERSINTKPINGKTFLRTGTTLFYGELNITSDEIYDTYLDPTGWGKGVIFINGFNLGRYWPLVGPQVTLYVPKELLRKGINKIVLLEYQQSLDASTIEFTDSPIFFT